MPVWLQRASSVRSTNWWKCAVPLSIRLDNDPEFIAHALTQWALSTGIALQHIQPEKPTLNAYVERFNKT